MGFVTHLFHFVLLPFLLILYFPSHLVHVLPLSFRLILLLVYINDYKAVGLTFPRSDKGASSKFPLWHELHTWHHPFIDLKSFRARLVEIIVVTMVLFLLPGHPWVMVTTTHGSSMLISSIKHWQGLFEDIAMDNCMFNWTSTACPVEHTAIFGQLSWFTGVMGVDLLDFEGQASLSESEERSIDCGPLTCWGPLQTNFIMFCGCQMPDAISCTPQWVN